MTALPSRTRRALALVLASALALGATACNPGRPPAVTVGGTDVSVTHVDNIVAAYAEASPDDRSAIQGAGAGTYDIGWVRDVLRVVVIRTLLSDLASERGLVPTEEEVTQARQDIEDGFSTATDPELGTRLVEALDEGTRDWLVALAADELALRRGLADEVDQDEAARAYYDENEVQFATGCLAVIVAPAEDLEAVLARLDAGDDFGTVSSEVTDIPELAAQGGRLGECGPLAAFQEQLGPEALQQILATEDGGVAGPFDAGDGRVVLAQVTERSLLAFEDVRQQIIDNVPASGEQAVSDLVQERIPDLDVRVDPRFGRWDPNLLAVVPLDGPRPSSIASDPDDLAVEPAVVG